MKIATTARALPRAVRRAQCLPLPVGGGSRDSAGHAGVAAPLLAITWVAIAVYLVLLRPTVSVAVIQAPARGSAHTAKGASAHRVFGDERVNFTAMRLKLWAALDKQQQQPSPRGCACTRTLSLETQLGGLGNILHNTGRELLAAFSTRRMLVQPRKYRLNEAPEEGKGTATVTFDSTPAESPYAAHDPRCKKLKDRTLDCFFLPLAACRASVATSSCEEDTREKLRAAYLKRWRYDAAGWKDVKHLGKKEQRGKLHSLELHMSLRTEGTMLGWLEKIPGYRVWTADEEETEEVDNIIQAYKKVTPTTISVRGAERVLQDYVHLGELWVFSQIMAYICRLRPSVAKVLRNHKLAKALRGRPYMAFHVRVTDNSGALWRTGLTPKIFEFAHFMTLAAKVRKTHPKMRTIYVAADKFHIDSAKAYTRHWDFIYNANADKKKSSTKEAIDDSEEIEYFLKNPHTMDVLLDLDIMKRADYMFGSMTSNFFRLASELNFAHHDDQQKRFFEVDRIPWETAEHG